MKKRASVATIYFPLSRLEEHGVIVSKFGEATAVRGGRRKKIYSVTELGFELLDEHKRVSDLLWQESDHDQ
ncbi:MAG: PadR family transcriptional regulator [Candidatus Aminicenantaceae bacterium]